jgi:hypothetical protein
MLFSLLIVESTEVPCSRESVRPAASPPSTACQIWRRWVFARSDPVRSDIEAIVEANVLDVSALRKANREAYRDSITQLSNSAVHRKNVDDSMLAGECYICVRGWQVGKEVATLRCECPSWDTRGLLGQVRFPDGRLPNMQKVDWFDRR